MTGATLHCTGAFYRGNYKLCLWGGQQVIVISSNGTNDGWVGQSLICGLEENPLQFHYIHSAHILSPLVNILLTFLLSSRYSKELLKRGDKGEKQRAVFRQQHNLIVKIKALLGTQIHRYHHHTYTSLSGFHWICATFNFSNLLRGLFTAYI